MSSLYPVNIDVKEAQILLLTRLFARSQKRIIKEINTATDFGVANRKSILSQIEDILLDLGTDVQGFVDDKLPPYYKAGAKDAVRQLKNIGVDVPIKTGFNQLHKDAIIALVDDTVARYAESITGIKRSTSRLLGGAVRDMIREEIAHGVITGEALRKVRRNIKGILVEEGLSALIDKGGRKWSLDRYSEMLFRVKVVEARNMGLANRMVENGYDLVQVSTHAGSCPLCNPWQGEILSITGDSKGYSTLQEATSDGLFHPNCRHAINTLIPTLARKTRAYDPEKGKLVKEPGESLKR